MSPFATRCAVVAVVGPPNAGKSSLLNRLTGEHLAIVSRRPQSTRTRVTGIVTLDEAQLVFVDTPGLLDPKYHLHRAMQHEAQQGVEGADIVLFLVDGEREDAPGPEMLGLIGGSGRKPVVVASTKADLVEAASHIPRGIAVSSVSGDGIDRLLDALVGLAPLGPHHYPADDLSTRSMRFFAAEAVREAAFDILEEELPYAVHVEIDEFRETSSPVYIRATLHVERASQKQIVVGARGSMIRSVGQAARARIEPLVGGSVYLDLWVKVTPNWRRDPAALARFGFTIAPDSP